MPIDLSGNGNLADEAALLTGCAAVIGAMTGTLVAIIRKDAKRTTAKIDEVVDTLNRVDEECAPGQTPSVGQRMVRIEREVEGIHGKIDGLHDDVRSLSKAMLSHITEEARRTSDLEDRVRQLDRRKWESEKAPTTPKRRTRQRSTDN